MTQIIDAMTQIIDAMTQSIDAMTQIIDAMTQIIDAMTQIIDPQTLYDPNCSWPPALKYSCLPPLTLYASPPPSLGPLLPAPGNGSREKNCRHKRLGHPG